MRRSKQRVALSFRECGRFFFWRWRFSFVGFRMPLLLDRFRRSQVACAERNDEIAAIVFQKPLHAFDRVALVIKKMPNTF